MTLSLTDHDSVRRVIEHEGQEVETMEGSSSRPGVRLGNKIEGGIGGICKSWMANVKKIPKSFKTKKLTF